MSTSADDIRSLLGDTDDLVIERIAETGATTDEIAEALRAREAERGFGEEPYTPSSERVANVLAILDQTVLDDDDDESPPVAPDTIEDHT